MPGIVLGTYICQMNGTQIAREFPVIKTQDSNRNETRRDVLEGFDRISKLNVRKFSNDYHGVKGIESQSTGGSSSCRGKCDFHE